MKGEIMKAKIFLMVLFVGLTTMGFDCVNDYLLAVNIHVAGTYNVTAGSNPAFNGCSTFRASDYLDQSYETLKNARIYNITVSTLGSFPGATVSGDIQVKIGATRTTILNFSGQWADFNTPQSLVTTTPRITRPSSSSAGLIALVNAVTNRQDFELCVANSSITTPVPNGLAVKLEIFGQVDGKP
jgi:hypothetical protein